MSSWGSERTRILRANSRPRARGPSNTASSVIAYVLGTHQDPQGYARQREMLQDAGCIVPETAARAAFAAAAIAVRDPSLVTRQPMSTAEIGLVTYSTAPRGGVVHTLYLAEALMDAGVPVHIVTLGEPGSGFFRPTRVPYTVVPAPAPCGHAGAACVRLG